MCTPLLMKKLLNKITGHPLASNPRTIAVLWGVMAVFAAIYKGRLDMHLNNFRIFRHVFFHLRDGLSLYAYYPDEYFDHNLYGPLFGVLVAPFAVLPPVASLILWELAMSALLWFVVLKLPLTLKKRMFIYWFVSYELLVALYMAQFNIAICALVVATYCAIRKGKVGWAACFIMLGTLTKLYGIVGLAFIVFTNKKWRFAGWLAIWFAVGFALPFVMAEPAYVLGQYTEWMHTLADKNALNADAFYQNISTLGMVHKISGWWGSDLWMLVPAMVLFLLPAVRVRQYGNIGFQWALVASVLMCIVLFSTGSESSGYIIALTGAALWYLTAPWRRGRTDLVLVIFVLVFASYGADFFPHSIRYSFMWPYALKALPVTLVWLKLIYEMCSRDYSVAGVREDLLVN